MGTVPFSPFINEERDCPLFRGISEVSAYFMKNTGSRKLKDKKVVFLKKSLGKSIRPYIISDSFKHFNDTKT